MLWTLATVGNWLWAVPGPTDQWASIFGDAIWPAVVVFLVMRFRRPLRSVIETLAHRFGRDHIKLGNWLEMTPNTTVIPLDARAAADESEEFDPADVKIIEKLLDFVAGAEGNRTLITRWIAANVGVDVDPLGFLSDPQLAADRVRAYRALIGESGRD